MDGTIPLAATGPIWRRWRRIAREPGVKIALPARTAARSIAHMPAFLIAVSAARTAKSGHAGSAGSWPSPVPEPGMTAEAQAGFVSRGGRLRDQGELRSELLAPRLRAEQQRDDKHDHGAGRRDQHRDGEAERLTGQSLKSVEDLRRTGPVKPAQIAPWW